jgi:hypothetical protein
MTKQKIVACDYRCYLARFKSRTPILWKRPLTPDELAAKPTGVEKGAKWDKENYRLLIYYNDSVGLHHRGVGARYMIEGGLKKWDKNKIGRQGNYNTKVSSAMKCGPFVVMDPDGNNINKDSDLIVPHEDYIRNASRNLVYSCRPKVEEWTASCLIDVIDPLFTENVVEAGLVLGGIYNGMGDYRMEFGKFDLISLEEVTNGSAAR